MTLPEKKNSIMNFADRMIYYMRQAYMDQVTNSPPPKQESWDGLEACLAYYLTRGRRFT